MQTKATAALGRHYPLVSCVMPTRDRKDFALRSIIYFKRQDYPARELIILDDSHPDLTECMRDQGRRIRCLHLDSRLSTGKKRDLGCELAQGEFVAQWDDDDWYAPGRLSAQLAPLLAGTADITGIAGNLVFDLTRWEFWGSAPTRKVIEGTLVYSREIWQNGARYPNQFFGECGTFLARAIHQRAIVEPVLNNGLFLYVRHTTNHSWPYDRPRYPRDWVRVAEPKLPVGDRAFYLEQQRIALAGLED